MTAPPAPSRSLLRRAVTTDEIAAMLDADGPFARCGYPGFSVRPGQQAMLRVAAECFAGAAGVHLAVEGGTGVGKSLAYLIPAALYAAAHNAPVVISTYTLNLQDQLIRHDIPQVLRVLAADGLLADPGALRYCALKGAGNYLCRARWAAACRQRSDAAADLEPWLEPWQETTPDGDVAALSLPAELRPAWAAVNAAGARECEYYRRKSPLCLLAQVRARAQQAHLLVVNHALYVQALERHSGYIPEHAAVVIDEAHRLAGVAGAQLSAVLSQDELPRLAAELCALAGNSGHSAARLAESNWELLWGGLRRLLDSRGAPVAGGERLEIADAAGDVDWQSARDDWHRYADRSLDDLHRAAVRGVRRQRELLDGYAETDASRLADGIADLRRRGAVVFAPDAEHVRVLQRGAGGVRAQATPLRVGDALRRLVFRENRRAVATSATLAAAGDDLRPLQDELGILPHQPTAVCPSPFDYRKQAMFLSPRDLPSPSRESAGHEAAVQEALLSIATGLGGRTLALFTAYAPLRRAAAALRARLQAADIAMAVQGPDGTANAVAGRLAAEPRTLAMGVDAMWEGIDLPPQSLRAVVICRLPFPVPTDPVIKARSALYGDPFREYYLPQAVRRFRQGCGRLIRTSESKGVIVVLDPRIRNQGYGPAFLQSLPPAVAMARSTLSSVAGLAREFIAAPP